MAYCSEQAYLFWLFAATTVKGWAISLLGNPEEGIPLIEKGLAGWETIGSIIVRPVFLGLLGEARALRGDLDGAMSSVSQGILIAERHHEFLSKLFLDRIKGELLHQRGSVEEAEKLLRATIERGLKAGARSFALASAIGLATVQRGRKTEGQEKVRKILGTYTEGFENPFIQRAQKVASA
jgi:ATP/maltotriose-dependent transcriptional regulator MalT